MPIRKMLFIALKYNDFPENPYNDDDEECKGSGVQFFYSSKFFIQKDGVVPCRLVRAAKTSACSRFTNNGRGKYTPVIKVGALHS